LSQFEHLKIYSKDQQPVFLDKYASSLELKASLQIASKHKVNKGNNANNFFSKGSKFGQKWPF
jgi:hypothetical protein